MANSTDYAGAPLPPSTSGLASELAAWASALVPSGEDLELARRSLVDTTAVAVAARDHHLAALARELGTAGRVAVAAHALDFDDVHMPSTSHVSAVCVPAAVAVGGDARAYLAGAGVMTRLGGRLGWRHYTAGWHATCTAGVAGAAVAAGIALGLDRAGLETAIALAVPTAGGTHRAFGTAAKPLQVGFAADAGVRAAKLARDGASADPGVLDQWVDLVSAEPSPPQFLSTPAVPDGLAIKLFPCCYALQRPIQAIRAAVGGHRPEAADVTSIVVTAPPDALRPLIHDRPVTGFEGKFSLPYGVVAGVLDERPGFASFTDAAVRRPDAIQLVERVEVCDGPGFGGLLAGTVLVGVHAGSIVVRSEVGIPLGAPDLPAPATELFAKVTDCAGDDAEQVARLTWADAGEAVPSLVLS